MTSGIKILIALMALGAFGGCQVDVASYSEPSHLRVARIFGDNMVLQRECEIPVWGSAQKGCEVTVLFDDKKAVARADSSGSWCLTLPKVKTGGPYVMRILAHDTLITYSNILMGEVWLASGQSNMHLDMSRTLSGPEDASRANNPMIRLYNMKPLYPTGEGGVYTETELTRINNQDYFTPEGWRKVDAESVKNFSAVAYYFAEEMQKKLKVPIGIIHNAVPGAPTESWVKRSVLLEDSLTRVIAQTPWQENEKNGVGKEMLKVAKHQVVETKNVLQQHPWMPDYCYKNGIEPLLPFAMKGVIWYQGESNAENPKLHRVLLTNMVKDWRADWHLGQFPFYYVQLSSREDRPAWPLFRDSQRQLLDVIPNTGMVVCSDVGDRKDTHARNKRPVGERLAWLALGNLYGIGEGYESPLYDTVKMVNDQVQVRFKGHFASLKTSDDKPVVGFDISTNGGPFSPVEAFINTNTIEINIPENASIIIRYAWQAYTEANLVSERGLPVSTFETQVFDYQMN